MYLVDVYLRIRRAVMLEGMSIREASRVFGLHRDTVRKMLAYSVPPGYRRQTPPRRPKLDPFTGVIGGILNDDLRVPRKQRRTAKRIFERIRDEYGFDGGYTIVKDYVREHGRQTKEMFVPLSHSPGQAQCDFGEALVVIGGVQRKAHCFVLNLPHNDGCFVKAYPAETTEAFLEGHVSALAFLGGIPQSILYDNTRLAVARILGDGKRQRTRAFTELQSHYLFEDRFGRPGKGNDKGKVEGLVGYTRRNFLVPIPSFESFDALNAHLEQRCLERMDAWPTEQQLFSYTFTLPANSRKYLNRLKDRKNPRKGNTKSESTRTPKRQKTPASQIGPPDKKSIKRPTAKQRAEDRRTYEKARSQTPERKAYQKRQRQKRIQIAKETGRCLTCENPAILGQNKCQTCTEKDRQYRRKSDTAKRAREKADRELRRQLSDTPPSISLLPVFTSSTALTKHTSLDNKPPKPPPDFDSTQCMLKYTALVNRQRHATLAGKPDLIAVKNSDAVIVDAKNGRPNSHTLRGS